jgi:LmbE family N-acetylglucosaminyl deacetylase
MKTVIYILPHQDDETFLIPKIRLETLLRAPQFIFFLTKSAVSPNLSLIREAESTTFLKSLGVQEKNILFLGSSLSVLDGTVIDNFLRLKEELINAIRQVLSRSQSEDVEFVTTAFEGGHHDHDAAYILTRHMANEFKAETKEVFLYNSYRRPGKLYRVAAPYGQGHYESYIYTPSDIFALLRVPLVFKSQWKAMLGLWPFLFFKSFFRPLRVRVTKYSNNLEMTHKYVPMYEKWGRTTMSEFNSKISALPRAFQE